MLLVLISGKREKGVVLRDPNFKYRTYDMVASAGLMLEEFIARFDRMPRSGQNLDHMKFIAGKASRPSPPPDRASSCSSPASVRSCRPTLGGIWPRQSRTVPDSVWARHSAWASPRARHVRRHNHVAFYWAEEKTLVDRGFPLSENIIIFFGVSERLFFDLVD